MTKILSILPLVILAGCTVGPNYAGPPAAASKAVARGNFVRAADSTFTQAPGLARWWESLNDPTLTALIDNALAHSPNIDVATARIREAQSQLRGQRAAELPSVSANASYLHAKLPGLNIGTADNGGSGGSTGGTNDSSVDFYNLGGTASWEPDLTGGGRRGIERARAQVGQSFAALADAQVSLTAQLAQAYVNLRDAQARIALNRQSTELQTRALALTRQRYAAGTASALDVERLQTQLDNTVAQTIPLGAQFDEYRDQIAVLTGGEPGALDQTFSTVASVPLPPAQIPIGDPAALIAHRPDVRRAERTLAANTAAIGVQRAKMFPSVRFMGIFGLGGPHIGDVVDSSMFSALLAPQINWSFLDFGRNRANLDNAKAQRDEATAQYREAVLEALQDAETSLSRFGHARQQFAQFLSAEASAARSARLNGQRVAAGTSSTIDQLDIERQRLAASIAAEQARAQLTNSYIAVQKALGLGWTDPAAIASR
jgi:NodT family efflux transporter outer membrane factor (OMF) lipoprotein